MRRHDNAKDTLRNTATHKGVLAKLGLGNFLPEGDRVLSKNTSRASISRVKRDDDLGGSKLRLHKFIENGSCYDILSRRESIDSKVSIHTKVSVDSRKQMMEETENYSDQLATLRHKNKSLEEENSALRKKVAKLTQQTTRTEINSFEFMDILQDSNRVLKQKLQESRKSSVSAKLESGCSLERMYQRAFTNGQMPEVSELNSAIGEYQRYYEGLFVKINFLINNTQMSSGDSNSKQLQNAVSAMKLPILYRQDPDFLQRLKDKPSAQKRSVTKSSAIKLSVTKPSNSRKERSLVEEISPELLSPSDTFHLLEKLLLKISKSLTMMTNLTSKPSLLQLLRRLCDNF